MTVTVGLRASWAEVIGYGDQAAWHFWATLSGRHPGLFPAAERTMLFPTIAGLVAGGDPPAGRAAVLAVLGRAHRQAGLLPMHYSIIGAALFDTLARHLGRSWTARLALGWELAYESAALAVIRAAADARDGDPVWRRGEVVRHERAADGVAVLTVRPRPGLPLRPGEAVPVHTPRCPGLWRWYTPAGGPRPDGTIDLYVWAVDGGPVSGALVHRTRPGELLWIGPPVHPDRAEPRTAGPGPAVPPGTAGPGPAVPPRQRSGRDGYARYGDLRLSVATRCRSRSRRT